MKVLGIQFDIAWENPEENFERLSPLLSRAAEAGADLAVLPEMFATGFSMEAQKVAAFAEETQAFLVGEARRLRIWILGGFVEPFSPRPRNVCALVDPEGQEVFRYCKIHPFTLAGEHERFTAGEAVGSAALEGVRITPFICYDLRFPEPFRSAAKETDLFVVMANWPVDRISAWKTLLAARAIENQCFVLGVNRVGEGGGKRYSGDSAFIDPFGLTLSASTGETALVGGEVEVRLVEKARKEFSFLADRRTELYRTLE